MAGDYEFGRIAESDQPDCAVCGQAVVGRQHRRAVSWIEDDVVITRHFCTDACLTEWRNEQA